MNTPVKTPVKILVIGGGMSGLTYGILCARNNLDVTVCEQNARVGKKLSQTGNGKCNLGNLRLTPDCYNTSAIATAVTQSVTLDDYLNFLISCGIYTHIDDQGRIYPITDSASAVVDCLRHTFAASGGKLQTDTQISAVTHNSGGKFTVTDTQGNAAIYDSVVLACGSGSSCLAPEIQGIVPQSYFTALLPSLVPVKVANAAKALDGIRARATVTLQADGKAIATESGEVQFKDYGLSGICIFNLSAHIARNTVLGQKHNYVFSVDLAPDFSQSQLSSILARRICNSTPTDQLFTGILRNKLAECVMERTQQPTADNLAHTAKNLQFSFSKLLDFSKSQVTAGGIADQYVDVHTLTLKNGIVALGEVLNVDGLCGGYNLYFAAASAIYAFRHRPT